MKLSWFRLIALTLCVISVVSASPLISRGDCSPNFEGADLIVTNSADPAWTTPEHAYRFEFTGQWPDTYLIKLSDQHEIVVAATGQTPGSSLEGVPINYSSSDPLQIWNVRCNTCGSPTPNGQFTTDCSISLRAANNLCIELDSGVPLLATCGNTPSQKWNFAKA